MPVTPSPLRYPGGKTIYAEMLMSVIDNNDLSKCTFVEAFAGGAGAAITLLLSGKVKSIFLNDIDPAIYSFWRSILDNTEEFLCLMHRTPITVKEWRKQREIYRAKPDDTLQLGFATFFLNRCNRAGILLANPIGGLGQKGKHKIDARFKKNKLDEKICAIANRKDVITIYNLDAVEFIKKLKRKHRNRKFLIYFDPPYYQKGELLYLNHYRHDDHEELSRHIQNCPFPWLLSYDNQPKITDLYNGFQIYLRNLRYSVSKCTLAQELIISNLIMPKYLQAL
ncbi:MAG: DNA adenine methylase [Candidatus Anammoxibacter sp.]